MICRDPSLPFKGFIHDFDYSFSWLRFLAKRKWNIDLAEWEKYCVECGHMPAEPGSTDVLNDSKERTVCDLRYVGVLVLISLVGNTVIYVGASFGRRDDSRSSA